MRLTTQEVADQLRCSRWSATRLMQSGEVPSARIAGHWTCAEADLEAYIEAQTVRAQPTGTDRRRRRRVSR